MDHHRIFFLFDSFTAAFTFNAELAKKGSHLGNKEWAYVRFIISIISAVIRYWLADGFDMEVIYILIILLAFYYNYCKLRVINSFSWPAKI